MIPNGLKILVCALIFFLIGNSTKAQLAEWLVAINHSYPVNDVTVDTEGSVYIVGNDYSSIYDSTLLDSIEISGKAFSSPHIKGAKFFLAKIDPYGKPIWMKMLQAKPFFNQLSDGVSYVTTDNNNDVIFNVEFYDTLVVENDTTIISHSPYNGSTMAAFQNALIKYDKDGNFKMATVISRRLCTQGRGNGKMECDSLNNFYFRFGPDTNGSATTSAVLKFDQYGQFVDSFYSDNPSDFTVNSQGKVYVGIDYGNEFLLEYDVSGILLQRIKTKKGSIKAEIIKSDYLDNIIMFCRSDDSLVVINTDTIKLDSLGGYFLISLTPSMTVNWFNKLEYGWPAGDITINQNNEVIYTNLGLVNGAERLHKLKGKHENSLGASIIKLNVKGEYVWSKRVEIYEGFDWPDITCDDKGHIYFTGYGHHPWYFSPPDFKHDSCFVDQLSAHGGKGFLLKLTDGTNQLSGYAFEDKNANGIPDSNDYYIPHQKVFIDSNYLAQTDSSGFYTMHVPKGNYSIAIKDTFSLYNFNPISHSANFNSGNASDSNNHFILIADSTVGLLETIKKKDISLYPNPCSGRINITLETSANNVQIQIYSVRGKLMKEKKFVSARQLQLDLPEETGLYFIEIRSENSSPRTFKVIRE